MDEIRPVVEQTLPKYSRRASKETVNRGVTLANIRPSVKQLLDHSPLLQRAIRKNTFAVRGALYNLPTGSVRFLK